MRRKIFICFFVVLLMTTMVVPVFASSSGGHDDDVFYRSAVQIDRVKFMDGDTCDYVADWPNNSALISSHPSDQLFSYYSEGNFRFSFSNNTLPFSTNIHVYDYRRIQICIDSLFIDSLNEPKFEINTFGGGIVMKRAEISGYVSNVRTENNIMETFRTPFFTSFELGYFFNVPYKISEAVAYDTALEDFNNMFLQNVVIDIEFELLENVSVDDPFINVTIAGTSTLNSFSDWFDDANFSVVVVSEPAPELFDWLLDSVNAFLNFELFPEFTLNRLFQVILVIGLLFWFVKLVI